MATMKPSSVDYKVYQGPGTNFATVGTVSGNENVTFMWNEGSWVYIEYTVGNTGFKKCGYVQLTQINGVGNVTFTPTMSNRYVGRGCIPFFGPGNRGYSHTDAIPQKAVVQYTGKKIGNYAFVQYSSNRRFWIFDNNLSTTMPTTGGYYTLPNFSYNFIQGSNEDWNKLNPKFTSSGCAVCCAADVVSFAEGKSLGPEAMYERKVFTSTSIECNWPNASTFLDWTATQYIPQSQYLEQIKYHINSGFPVVIKLKNNQHWVVAYGYSEGASSAEYVYVKDPISSNKTTLKDSLSTHSYDALKFVYFKK